MRIEEVNLKILKECREQLHYSLSEVEKKVKTISKIESGEKKPTLRQLDTLSHLYDVPRWVFLADSLPEKYILSKQVPVFRKFKEQNEKATQDPKFCKFIRRIEDLRKFILEIKQDIGEEISSFQPPPLENDIEKMARNLRKWLKISENECLDFNGYKEKLEDKNIFVFLTNKYSSWSKMEAEIFRGFAIYYEKLPILVINDSDAKKAQSFTLFHELGHLIQKENSINRWSEETWCDKLAGSFLMPYQKMKNSEINPDIHLKKIDQLSKKFKVSSYAFLVRLKQLQKINQEKYNHLEQELKEKYEKQKEELKKELKEKNTGIPRDRIKEIKNQYGNIYINSVSQLYYNKEISLHKLSQLLELKRPSDALKMV